MPRRWKVFLPVAILVIAADQITKQIAEKALADRVPVSVIPNFWDWQLAYNTGSAFSFFTGKRIFLTIVGIVAVALLLWFIQKTKDLSTTMLVALGLMTGGAIGNLIDRILYGKVIDFILWRYYEHRWPVFNIADVCLTCSVALILLSGSFEKRKKRRESPASAVS